MLLHELESWEAPVFVKPHPLTCIDDILLVVVEISGINSLKLQGIDLALRIL